MIETSPDVPKDLKTRNDPANIAPHIGVQDFFDIADLTLEDFKGKNIADIAGGAGLLSLYIQNEAKPAHVVLIDQDLKKKSFEDIVKRAKKTFEKFSQAPAGLPKLEQQLHDTSIEIQNVLHAKGDNKERDLEDGKRTLVKEIKKRMKDNKENAELMDKYLTGEYNGVELNNSSGDKIEGVESNSQDIVFINHILCILPDVYFQILEEANRILKEDGTIIIIDYPHYNIEGYGDYFREICDKHNIITKESKDSICIKLKKGEYVKLQQ